MKNELKKIIVIAALIGASPLAASYNSLESLNVFSEPGNAISGEFQPRTQDVIQELRKIDTITTKRAAKLLERGTTTIHKLLATSFQADHEFYNTQSYKAHVKNFANLLSDFDKSCLNQDIQDFIHNIRRIIRTRSLSLDELESFKKKKKL